MKVKFILSAIMVLILGISAIACTPVLGETSTDHSGQTIPQGSAVVIPNRDMVLDFVKNTSTYQFDGIDGTLRLINATSDAADRIWEYTVEYQTRHAGHGDRTGHMMAQVITTHTAVVILDNGQITSAVCDNSWDMLQDAPAATPQPEIHAPLGQQFSLAVGQSASISGEDLVIKFVEVSSDSRSPKGAETLWAGEASCRIQVTYLGGTSEATLHESGATDGFTQASILQYNLAFQLTPYPEIGKQPASSDYTLQMIITK
jgi:hypothetical protein